MSACFWNQKLQIPQTSHKRSVPVSDWLSTRYLLRLLDDNIVEHCYNEIVASFRNKKDIIYMLIKSAPSHQLKNIREILKNGHSKFIEDNNDKNKNKNKNNNKKNNNNKSNLNFLSIESVHNICAFLTRQDLRRFKIVSVSMALIIFDIMKCYKIGVFDMNELIEKNEYKFESNLNIFNKLKIKRVKPLTKYKILMDVYCKKYNISFENMLLFRSNTSLLHKEKQFVNGQILKSSSMQFDAKVDKNSALFIFDKSKILIFNNTQNPVQNNAFKISGTNHYDYDLTLLRYFNKHSQRIRNVQFLLFDKRTTNQRIEEYIANELKSIICDSWCDELSSILSKMKHCGAHDHQLLKIYNTKKDHFGDIFYTKYNSVCSDKYKSIFNGLRVITFEINENHPAAGNIDTNKVDLDPTKPVYLNLKQLTKDQLAEYSLSMVNTNGDFANQLKYFGIETKYKSNITLYVTPLTTYKMLQHKISQIFNNKIQANNIKIYTNIGQRKHIFLANEKIGRKDRCTFLRWMLVLYDADKKRKLLENLKNELTKQEYATFKCVLKLLSVLKNSNNEKQFELNVVTPFMALFSGEKRKHFLKDLQRYIPKQFLKYYMRQVKERRKINKTGYKNLCKTLMSDGDYNELQQYLKLWEGISGNDMIGLNVKSIKKDVLQDIVNVFIKSCKNQLKNGHLSNFRCLAAGFDKTLTKKEDKQIYHYFIQTADEMQQHLKNFKTRQKQKK